MSEVISRVLLVLSSPVYESDERARLPRDICKFLSEEFQKKGLSVDLIDLYTDSEFDPVWNPEVRDTKTIEYQIRVKKAQLIVFIHPVWWIGLPALMKGFVDKTFTQGFAYNPGKPNPVGLLKGKKTWVLAFSDRPTWEYRFIQRDALKIFWKRGVNDQTGMKLEKFKHFGNLRSASQRQIKAWKKSLTGSVKSLNTKESLLDLL